MEDYLRRCLDSLLVSNGLENLEILVVNDGSKDSTLNIANEYVERYPNVFRIIDKSNGNYGSCVNRGLREISGKYVKILDADDSFDTRGFETYISRLLVTDVDLILSDFVTVSEDGTMKGQFRFDLPTNKIMRMEEVCTEPSFMKMQMHAVTYRTALLREMEYHQTERISYTDQQWIFMPMYKVRTVCYIPFTVYRYLLGRDGQTVNADTMKYVSHLIPCMRDIVNFYSMHRQKIGIELNEYYRQAILIPLIKAIYVQLILVGTESAGSLLRNFDKNLRSWNEEVYDLIGSREISSFLGFEYINFWREHTNIPSWIVRIIGFLYVRLLHLKRIL